MLSNQYLNEDDIIEKREINGHKDDNDHNSDTNQIYNNCSDTSRITNRISIMRVVRIRLNKNSNSDQNDTNSDSKNRKRK